MTEYKSLQTIEQRIEYILNIENYEAKGYGQTLRVYQEAAARIVKLET